jgi:hypothetical protein
MAARPSFGRVIQQLWNALTVPMLAGLLVALVIVAVLVDVTTNALDAWMPNIATGAASIAITITVVDRLIRRADDARLERRRLQAYRRLAWALLSLTQSVLSDYLGTHLQSDIQLSGDPAELLTRWREDDPDTPRRRPPEGARPFVLEAAVEFAAAVKRVAEVDHDVLPNDLLATISDPRQSQPTDELEHPLPAPRPTRRSNSDPRACRLLRGRRQGDISYWGVALRPAHSAGSRHNDSPRRSRPRRDTSAAKKRTRFTWAGRSSAAKPRVTTDLAVRVRCSGWCRWTAPTRARARSASCHVAPAGGLKAGVVAADSCVVAAAEHAPVDHRNRSGSAFSGDFVCLP